MSETNRTILWAAGGALLGAIVGAVIGNLLAMPGAGPTGIGLAVGAVAGSLLGLPKERGQGGNEVSGKGNDSDKRP